MRTPFPSASEVVTVSALARAAKSVLEQAFPLLWLSGEISNLTRAASGHWYFSLKDEKAQVRCVMFRHRNQYLEFMPENGMHVEARVVVTLYEPRGDFQLTVETLRPAGLGALYEAFEKLKMRMTEEGLFDTARKRPLPVYPRCVGVVTSPAAAALRDVLTTLRRRMPGIPVILYPTPVQGKGAAAEIASAIRTAGQRAECDVLIVCRGGGSIEDLWEFNEESVARAIVACPIPVVCGVGHETDITIADFAADQRAPTPTAAAEMATPSRAELSSRLSQIENALSRLMTRRLESSMLHLDHLSRRLIHPGERLRHHVRSLDHLQSRMKGALDRRLADTRWRMERAQQRLITARPHLERRQEAIGRLDERLRAAANRLLSDRRQTLQRVDGHLKHLNPQAVLERGYSIVRNAEGEILRSGDSLSSGDLLNIRFAVGGVNAKVTESSD